MMGYDYEVLYRKGSANTVADALFRKPQLSFHAISIVTSELLRRIHHSWFNDDQLVQLLHKLESNPAKESKYS